MIYLMYQLNSKDNLIDLYKIEEGKKHYLRDFMDRENLLLWLEANYDMANLLIINKNNNFKI